MRACIYARYSTDRQSESSIDDQARGCRARAAAEGWTIVAQHGDDGVSGSTPVAARPGGRALLADVLARRWDVLMVEGLDRLSRDMVESERIIRRLEHAGVRILGIADGYDSASAARKLHRGMRGLLNDVYLDDLRHKTHRGLAGQVARGYHAGGRSYGYRSTHDGHGHRLEIEPRQAEVVRRIYELYGADGWSVQRIAATLNAEGVPSPRGGTWAVSALYGVPAKGSGILCNELYVGRVVWNRGQWVKDPDTGKRQRIARPAAEWQTADHPELRIVTDAAWAAVRARMARPRTEGGPGRAPAPRTLLGGLLRCGRCGGAMVAIDARRYGCAASKDRGSVVCPGIAVARRVADDALLEAARAEFCSPESLLEFQAALADIGRRQAAEGRGDARKRAERLAALDAEIGRLVDAIAAVGLSDALRDRLQAAEAERTALRSSATPIARQRAGIPAGEALAAYRRMVARLQESTDRDTLRATLAEMLGRITVQAEADGLWAVLETDAPAVLAVAGAPLRLVAGAGFGTRRRIRLAQRGRK